MDEGATTAVKPAILPLQVEGGEIPEADQKVLSGELVKSLRERGAFQVIPPEQVLEAVPNAGKCDNGRCAQRIADKTQATHVVRTVVTVQDRDYDVKISLIDGKSGSVLAKTGEGCEICGIADVGQIIATNAATLKTKLEALARGPASLKVESTPAGAVVTIDGEVAGTTPLDRPSLPGKHVIRVSAEGYIAVEREVTSVEGVDEQIAFELEKVPSKLPGATWGWVSLGVGAAGLATGLAFVAIDGEENQLACDAGEGTRDADGDCKYLWDTKWPGAGASIAGAALLTLGVTILVNSGIGKKNRVGGKTKKDKKQSRRPNFGVGPGSVVLSGRF